MKKGLLKALLSITLVLSLTLTEFVNVYAVSLDNTAEIQIVENEKNEIVEETTTKRSWMPNVSILGTAVKKQSGENFLAKFFRQLFEALFGKKRNDPVDKKENEQNPPNVELTENGTNTSERIGFYFYGDIQNIPGTNEYNTTVGSDFTLSVEYTRGIYNLTRVVYGYGAVMETGSDCPINEWSYDYIAINAIDMTVIAHGMYSTIDPETGATVRHELESRCIIHVKPSPTVPFGFRDVTKTELEVIAYYGSGKKDIVIPSTFMNYNITYIGPNAFEDNNEIEKVTLPDNFKQIGYHAFYHCKKLKTVSGLNNVEFVNEHAFDGCPLIG